MTNLIRCKVGVDGTVTYFYRQAQATHITYPSGVQLLHFANNQTERHYPDGTKDITFPNKVRKRFYPDGKSEVLS
jgi:centromere protein J